MHFIIAPKLNHDPLLERHQFIQCCQKVHQRLKRRMILNICCTFQVKITDMVRIRLWLWDFVFMGFNFHGACFPETEGIFLTKQSAGAKTSALEQEKPQEWVSL